MNPGERQNPRNPLFCNTLFDVVFGLLSAPLVSITALEVLYGIDSSGQPGEMKAYLTAGRYTPAHKKSDTLQKSGAKEV
jgi:hypothetical protein